MVQPDHGRGQFQAEDGSNNAHFYDLQPTPFCNLTGGVAAPHYFDVDPRLAFHFDVDTDRLQIRFLRGSGSSSK